MALQNWMQINYQHTKLVHLVNGITPVNIVIMNICMGLRTLLYHISKYMN